MCLAGPALAQDLVHGTVLDGEAGTPLRDARVTLQSTGVTVLTDGRGRFRTVATALPDTITVRAIGYAPASIILTRAAGPNHVVRLVAAPMRLADIAVTGHGQEVIAAPPQWSLPPELIRELPAAIEPDAFRGLQLVPGVAFSSVYSARPLLRGYAADDGALRIDGFEVLNLYHIGRAFSAFPVDAASAVTVTPGVEATARAEALSGSVELAGRQGPSAGRRGGVALSPASLAGWFGGGDKLRAFGLGRVATFGTVDFVSGRSIPYDFLDGYGSVALTSEGAERGRLTLFGSRDHLYDAEAGSGMDWNNLLVGVSGLIAAPGRHRLAGRLSYTRFSEVVRDVAARNSRVDVDNLFARLQAGLDWGYQAGQGAFEAGVVLSARRIANSVTPTFGQDFPADSFSTERPELGGHAAWRGKVGPLQVDAGARFDAAGDAFVLQPRAAARVSLGGQASLGFGAGRSSRLFHLVSDPIPEPDLAFYDFWLDAAREDTPTPIVDHASADLSWARNTVSVRLGLYASRGRGLVELRPATDQDTAHAISPFRSGDSRTAGFEANLTWQSPDGAHALAAIYALTASERRWGGGWIPWQLDRRHLVRLQARTTPARGLVLTLVTEYMSGAPMTPVTDIVISGVSGEDGGLDPSVPRVRYVYGAEGALRGGGTLRADVGGTYSVGGPWGTFLSFGVSVLNLSAGAVAPEAPRNPADLARELLAGQAASFSYVRTFDLPPVPTVFLRVVF